MSQDSLFVIVLKFWCKLLIIYQFSSVLTHLNSKFIDVFLWLLFSWIFHEVLLQELKVRCGFDWRPVRKRRKNPFQFASKHFHFIMECHCSCRDFFLERYLNLTTFQKVTLRNEFFCCDYLIYHLSKVWMRSCDHTLPCVCGVHRINWNLQIRRDFELNLWWSAIHQLSSKNQWNCCEGYRSGSLDLCLCLVGL